MPGSPVAVNLFTSAAEKWVRAMQRGDVLDASFYAREVGVAAHLVGVDPGFRGALNAGEANTLSAEAAAVAIEALFQVLTESEPRAVQAPGTPSDPEA